MTVDSLAAALPELRRPFTVAAVNWKIQTNPKPQRSGNGMTKALIVGFMDARMCAERLNAVVGADWSDDFGARDGSSVTCRLTVFGATRVDVGFTNDHTSDMGMKAMYSDAFKRACVKFGIGAYLYAMPRMFVDASQLKQAGTNWYLTRDSENYLASQYTRWLDRRDTVAQFGAPRDHGDSDDAQGDVDTRQAPAEAQVDHATPEQLKQLKQRSDARGLAPGDVAALADAVGVPAADALRDRFKAATRDQVAAMLDRVELTEPTAAPIEGVAA